MTKSPAQIKKRWKHEIKRRKLKRSKKRYLAQSPLPPGDRMQGWDAKRRKEFEKKAKRRAVQKNQKEKTRKALDKLKKLEEKHDKESV